MSKYYITGSTRGLGKFLAENLDSVCFDRPLNIDKDWDYIIKNIEPGATVILNAYANGSQSRYMRYLCEKNPLIVIGSIASSFPDPYMKDYSLDKKNLEEEFLKLSVESKMPMLYLKLTSGSYRNHQLILDTIKYWQQNPFVNFVGFKVE